MLKPRAAGSIGNSKLSLPPNVRVPGGRRDYSPCPGELKALSTAGAAGPPAWRERGRAPLRAAASSVPLIA